MIRLLQRTSGFLSSHSSAYVILAAIVAFFVPETFSWVKGDVSSIILGIIMLTMGLTLSIDDFRELFNRPLDILIGACAQYTLMPLIAWGLSVIFNLNPYLSIGIILVGCCPGGVSSNIMSYLCRGDVAYSVGMTTASTLLAPRIEVDVAGMFRGILLITLIPVGIGFLANTMIGKKKAFRNIQSIMPGVSVTCLALIVGGVVAQVTPQLMNSGVELFLLMLCIVFLHNTLGYATGYGIGYLFGFNTAKKRTISIEVGMQNAGMATVLATSFFAKPEILSNAPEAILCVVPCALSCAYHSISGTILANLYVKMDRK